MMMSKLTPLQELQKKIGVNPDNDFGPKTLKAGVAFLKLSKEQGAHFFAQVAHESGMFKRVDENLNYSYLRLLQIFKSDFDVNKNRFIEESEKVKARNLAGKPREIANFVYANQNGNGNEASGDGWKHRGFGFLQTTGKYNQEKFFASIGLPANSNPELIATDYPLESAKFFFDSNNLWKYCNSVSNSNITTLSKRINGGTNGLSERRKLTYRYYNLIKN